jgi:hypothetical protein
MHREKKRAARPLAPIANPVDFLLSFTGLCTFVPRYDITIHANHATVLLVDAHSAHGTSHHMPHEPVLICALGLVDPNGRQPDYTWPSTIKQMALFYLQDQDVSSQPDAEQLTFTTGLKQPTDSCPTHDNYQDVLWIAPLEEINRGSGKMKTSCLGGGTDPSFGARVALSQGTLHSSQIARHGSKKAVIWQFGVTPNTPDIPLEQALADLATLETQVSGQANIVTTLIRPATNPIVAKDFPGGVGTSQTIILKPITTGAPIEARILNSPLPDIVGTPPAPNTPRDPDYHFGQYYQLSATSGLPLVEPFADPKAVDSCPAADVPSLNTTHCPPSLALPEK